MEQKRYIITLMFEDWGGITRLITDHITLIQLHDLLSRLDVTGQIYAINEYVGDETD